MPMSISTDTVRRVAIILRVLLAIRLEVSRRQACRTTGSPRCGHRPMGAACAHSTTPGHRSGYRGYW